jgi:hypothetical protein
MKMLRSISAVSAATLAAFAAAAAAPRSIADCEKIQAADAYNRCLASFGPVAPGRAHKALPYASADESRGGRGSGVTAIENRGGRARIELTPRRAKD